MTVFTAILSRYEDLKEPSVITDEWKYICYTDQDFVSDVWQIKKVDAEENSRLQARRIKIMFHEYIQDEFSLWIDGSFKINVDLNEWWQRFKAPITCIPHPVRHCIFAEGQQCMKTKPADRMKIQKQMQVYRNKVLANNGLIQSGILMRQRTDEVIELCKKWFVEVEKHSSRDQIGFGFASLGYNINFTPYDYRTGKEFEFIKHYHRRK